MVDDDSYDWFRGSEQRPVMFEHRIPEIMQPIMEEVGLKDVIPDLITIGSLFWDEAFLTSVSLCLHSCSRTRRQGDVYIPASTASSVAMGTRRARTGSTQRNCDGIGPGWPSSSSSSGACMARRSR
jgi:hypothetical protein